MKQASLSTVRRGAFLGLALLLCAGAAQAQLYKWTDANGKTHFSDQPPPESAKPATVKTPGAGTPSADMPYVLATAMRNYPVTLYTTKTCGGCDQGRTFLRARGIPFTEKTLMTAADEAKLKELGGDGHLPFLTVGKSKVTGFSQSSWETMLNVAQYPATKALPLSYQYPAPAPLVEAQAPAAVAATAQKPDREALRAAAQAEAAKRREEAAKAAPDAPPGFRF